MITLSNKLLEERFDRLWRELQRFKSEDQSLSQDELDEECIIFLEGRVLGLLVAKDKKEENKIQNEYYEDCIQLTDEDMDAMHDAIDEAFPPKSY